MRLKSRIGSIVILSNWNFSRDFKHKNESVDQAVVEPITMSKIIKRKKFAEKIDSVKKKILKDDSLSKQRRNMEY
jgi:hypothetical protein